MDSIRNFSIIAHIDHGKSTLADRMLEITKTIEARRMRSQVLDQMELERERGITIKMAPVTMKFSHEGKDYTLNLIDTPGHIDFAYEVSRALKAVEGAILLVDSTQGVQAQTLSVLEKAREFDLEIIPVITKIDSPRSRPDDVKKEINEIIGVPEEDIHEVSGKTGEGVEELLKKIVERVSPPKEGGKDLKALIFDFIYSNHKGIVLHSRLFGGSVKSGDQLVLASAKESFNPSEVGVFSPDYKKKDALHSGEIGYIVTGIKRPGIASVGDTVIKKGTNTEALSGYEIPSPVVWAGIYPESEADFDDVRRALERIRLSDSAFTFEEESSGAFGRGFRCGFLGMLHLEIVIERLKREHDLSIVVTSPSITYEVEYNGGKKERILSPAYFPEHGSTVSIKEPWVSGVLITPSEYLSPLSQILHDHEAEVGDTDTFGGDRLSMKISMPLRELMRGFFDKVKSASSGYASFSYKMHGEKEADVARLDVLVAGDVVPAFSKVVSRKKVQEEAEKTVERLYEVLPRQLFVTKIQGKALGRILSSKTLKALRKDVTGHLYGGDVTRKKKLLEKQKKGKKKLGEKGKVNIPHETFLKMINPS